MILQMKIMTIVLSEEQRTRYMFPELSKRKLKSTEYDREQKLRIVQQTHVFDELYQICHFANQKVGFTISNNI